MATPAAATPPVPALSPADALLTRRELLGNQLLTDSNLSEPTGTACASCHRATMGFAGNNGSRIGVAEGSLPTSLGLRNAQTNAYASFAPPFAVTVEDGGLTATGGHFWDGRVDTLAAQALLPLLNPLEMNNPSAASVVSKVAAAGYAAQFRAEFGANTFANPDQAFRNIGLAIEAFERSAQLQSFSSKYDDMVRDSATFTAAESRGMALFMDPARANCAGCHKMNPSSGRPEDSLFTDFEFYATGVPRNTQIPRNADPAFFDLGVCGPEGERPPLPVGAPAGSSIDQLCGKFRMPTLRNVAQRPAFMHNGFFKDLREVVRFYSTRNTDPRHWYGASGTPNDLPATYLGNVERNKAPFNRPSTAGPLLTEAEISDLLAFLQTLSDTKLPQ